jgi:hypothetical protein
VIEMSTIDVVKNNSVDVSVHKKAASEKTRQIVLDMIDKDINQYIVDRSKERRRNGNVPNEVTDEQAIG